MVRSSPRLLRASFPLHLASQGSLRAHSIGRYGKGIPGARALPFQRKGNQPVDDHSQSDLHIGPSGERCAADCIDSQPARSESSARSVIQRPFVWQCGRRLLLLEWELGYWVLAELEFDSRLCRYTELRRAFYQWEREAVGALLSRTIAYGDEAAVESAALLDEWISHRR